MRKIASTLIPISLGLLTSFGTASQVVAQDVPIDRTVLPIPQPVYPSVTELDARNVKPPPFFEVKAPDGAPNVLIVLIDDMGFGQSSAFGGPVHMPTVEALANEGLRFNEFHTTALCSPTRAALLTGRQCGNSAFLARQTAGQHAPALTSSMASSAARRINGLPRCGTE